LSSHSVLFLVSGREELYRGRYTSPRRARREVIEKLRETLKVNERRDDTTKPEAESRPAAPAAGRYYYDDATGYETYRPEEEEPDTEAPEDDKPEHEGS
jgi:hypothetical protein